MKKIFLFLNCLYVIFFVQSQNEWTVIHPTPTLSNLIDVHFINQDTGWAVGTGGTVLFTNDGGINWEFQHRDPDESFWSVFFIDDNEGWVCGWSMIYHTENAGQSWEVQSHPYCMGDLTDIMFINPDTGWVVGRYKIVMKTTDGGESWTKIMNSIYQPYGFLRVDFYDHLHGCAVGDNLGGYPHLGFIMITNDGGETWTETTPPNCDWLTDVEYYNDMCIWICGGDGNVYRSIDGGLSWYQMYNGWEPYQEIHFFNQNDGMLLTPRGARLSFDAGNSWDSVSYTGEWYNSYHAFMSWEDAKGVAVGYDGVMSRTLDGCATWHHLHHGIRTYFNKIGFFDQHNGMVLGGDYYNPSLFTTSDGGYSWNYDTILAYTSFSQLFVNDQQAYLYNKDSITLIKSIDAGANWQLLSLPEPTSYYTDMQFVNENTGYLCGLEGNLIKTVNGGVNWSDLSLSDYNNLRSLFFVDETNGWMIEYDDKLILHTTDGGQSWTGHPIGNGLIYQPGTLFFLDEHSGFLHTEEGFMFDSDDGGETWKQLGFLSSGQNSEIYFADYNEGWILTGRVFHTLDGGLTWDEGQHFETYSRSMFFIDKMQGWVCGADGLTAKYDGTIRIKDLKDRENEISLFPNPVGNHLNIVLDHTPGQQFLLQIFDMSGKKCLDHYYIYNPGGLQINTSVLPAGSYLIQIHTSEKQYNSKFVKI